MGGGGEGESTSRSNMAASAASAPPGLAGLGPLMRCCPSAISLPALPSHSASLLVGPRGEGGQSKPRKSRSFSP